MRSVIRFPVLGQVIPRIEIEISSAGYRKKVTVRVNQSSPFMFDGHQVSASLNGRLRAVDPAPTSKRGDRRRTDATPISGPSQNLPVAVTTSSWLIGVGTNCAP